MGVDRKPLSQQEYQEYLSLDQLTMEQRKKRGKQLIYLDLRFRYLIQGVK